MFHVRIPAFLSPFSKSTPNTFFKTLKLFYMMRITGLFPDTVAEMRLQESSLNRAEFIPNLTV